MGGIEGGELAEKIMQRACRALFLELFRRAIGHDLAAIDNYGAGARSIDFFENMSRKENALGRPQAFDELSHLVLLIRIETVGGLIENQDLGVVQQRLREASAMTVALGKRIDRLMSDRAQKAGVDGAFDCLFFRQPGQIADIGAEFQETDDRHVIVERRRLGEVADFILREEWLINDRVTTDLRIARAGRDKAGDHAHRGRLPGAVGSKETEHFAGFDREREIIDRVFGPKVFGEIFNFDHNNRCECFSSRVQRIA